jgi:hypothetical protein
MSLVRLLLKLSLPQLTFFTGRETPSLVAFAVTRALSKVVVAANLACIYSSKRVENVALREKLLEFGNSFYTGLEYSFFVFQTDRIDCFRRVLLVTI